MSAPAGSPDRVELLERCVAWHGHLCMGQVLGLRLGLKGMELLGTRDPKRLVLWIENARCLADAVQVATGTRVGKRSAKIVDLGKSAVTFLDCATGRAFRVRVRDFAHPPGASEESCRAALDLPDEEMLEWREVRVRPGPMEMPGRPLRVVTCAHCGETVLDGRDVPGTDGPLCRACAGGAYYEEIPPGD
jgi:formylmethanofuran dehydrogenase subunit E